MRISDWSSDVCSSDLGGCPERPDHVQQLLGLLCQCEIRRWRYPALRLHGCERRNEQHDLHPRIQGIFEQAQEIEESRSRRDRKSVVEGKSVSVRVDHGGRRLIKKKKTDIKETN